MKSITIAVAALAAFMAGPAVAEVILHTSPLPAKFMPHEQGAHEQGGQRGYWFRGHTTRHQELPGDGDEVFLRMHGFQGIQLVGLPPFVREVSTADGHLLRGIPQPGNYTVEMWRDGKRIPTLDMHMRFIPR
ncbi:hypothetical protein [Neorhizobium sp. S3-V5DH]|uniref:hypothetical protein n=1 Tax=Neorhizobium sp. S3-V5DH TaxID=2485166 RepID=UPI001043B6C1|nr:hypothetical protein [Neorhizobium sp. S3-V5DH]TCV76017.1 hypothetical protein EDE09_101300 [Neorhizobium sp. S3-V5DH]